MPCLELGRAVDNGNKSRSAGAHVTGYRRYAVSAYGGKVQRKQKGPQKKKKVKALER